MRLHLRVAVALGLLMGSAGAATPVDPDKDAAMTKLLAEARNLIDARKPAEAIVKCEQLIASFRAHYAERKEKVYCARTSAESLGYMLISAGEINRGPATKSGAIVLSPTWSNACFMKGYALLDLGRRKEAMVAVRQALDLAPWNPQYLSEMGNLYLLEKNWIEAGKLFELAEDQATLSPDDRKADELARARRGSGYVLVELGQLEKAAKKYEECLAADPKDTKAAEELKYVRGRLEKKK